MIDVLFICVHNSARSQMAEAYLRTLGGSSFSAQSAGLEAGMLNPYTVRAMREDGIDISAKSTKTVEEVWKSGKKFHYVVTVCSKDAADRCPIFPGRHRKLFWPFPDPASFSGTDGEIMAKVREIRDGIKSKVLELVRTASGEST